jgi:hypothetical protein
MFDGTDLSMAYGTSLAGGSGNFGNALGGASHNDHGAESQGFLLAGNGANVQLPPPPQNTSTDSIVMPPETASTSHAMPPEVPYYPPQAMYNKGGSYTRPQTDSMWDKMGNRKYDVLKLVVLSLVILLAMSSDRVVNYYLSKYLTGGLFTTTQEFFVRLSYPLLVLLLLWWIKAMSS